MSETTSRVLQLLGLLQSRRVWTGEELSERLGVTGRSVRRDVERLRDLGYPVHASKGHGGGYQLGAGAAMPPLLLDPEEAVAMAVCLRVAAGGSVAGVGESALRALTKLDQVMPARPRSQVSAVHDATVTLTSGQSDTPVEPDRQDWRSLRLDWMADVHALGSTFTPREAPDAASYVRRAISAAPYRHVAKVRYQAPREVVAQMFSAASVEIQADGDDACIVTTGADDPERMVLYLALPGCEFEVLEPPEVVEAVRDVAERLTRAAR